MAIVKTGAHTPIVRSIVVQSIASPQDFFLYYPDWYANIMIGLIEQGKFKHAMKFHDFYFIPDRRLRMRMVMMVLQCDVFVKSAEARSFLLRLLECLQPATIRDIRMDDLMVNWMRGTADISELKLLMFHLMDNGCLASTAKAYDGLMNRIKLQPVNASVKLVAGLLRRFPTNRHVPITFIDFLVKAVCLTDPQGNRSLFRKLCKKFKTYLGYISNNDEKLSKMLSQRFWNVAICQQNIHGRILLREIPHFEVHVKTYYKLQGKLTDAKDTFILKRIVRRIKSGNSPIAQSTATIQQQVKRGIPFKRTLRKKWLITLEDSYKQGKYKYAYQLHNRMVKYGMNSQESLEYYIMAMAKYGRVRYAQSLLKKLAESKKPISDRVVITVVKSMILRGRAISIRKPSPWPKLFRLRKVALLPKYSIHEALKYLKQLAGLRVLYPPQDVVPLFHALNVVGDLRYKDLQLFIIGFFKIYYEHQDLLLRRRQRSSQKINQNNDTDHIFTLRDIAVRLIIVWGFKRSPKEPWKSAELFRDLSSNYKIGIPKEPAIDAYSKCLGMIYAQHGVKGELKRVRKQTNHSLTLEEVIHIINQSWKGSLCLSKKELVNEQEDR
jgi:hypothetical protein